MPELPTRLISIDDPDAISAALQVLEQDGILAFPTDTVYGLGALAHSREGIDRLFEAKIRDTSKAIAVLIGDLEQLELVAADLPESAHTLAKKFWPGAITLIMARHTGLPENISPWPTIGVRMPDHAFACALIQAAGPLATTSANLSGGPDPKTAQDVLAQLRGRVGLVLDGGDARGGVPSTVVDCTRSPVAILRHGAIPDDEIFQALNQT